MTSTYGGTSWDKVVVRGGIPNTWHSRYYSKLDDWLRARTHQQKWIGAATAPLSIWVLRPHSWLLTEKLPQYQLCSQQVWVPVSFLAHRGVARKGEAHRLSCHMRVTQKMSGSAIKNQVHNKTFGLWSTGWKGATGTTVAWFCCEKLFLLWRSAASQDRSSTQFKLLLKYTTPS